MTSCDLPYPFVALPYHCPTVVSSALVSRLPIYPFLPLRLLCNMTSATAEEPTRETTGATAPPRKRRRRTGAGGAQDDCFACRKRAVPCDRKRPYCTQCIEIGKECSGYKTTLTWGVGVASRGKLRGLSCPVQHKNGDSGDNGIVGGSIGKRRKNSVAQPKAEPAREAATSAAPVQQLPLPTSPPAPTQSFPPASIPIPVPQLQTGWHVQGFQDHQQVPVSQASPHRLQTTISPHFEHGGYAMSAASVSSYAEEWHSPVEFPQTPGSVISPDQYQPMHSYMDQATMSSSADSYQQSLGSSVDSIQSNTLYDEAPTMDPSSAQLSFPDAVFDDTFIPHQDEEAIDPANQLSLMNARFGQPLFYLPPRLQNLIGYYDQHICPFLVAFDTPENPYRLHIINLASQNDGLQNAIAALATNNMRMRRIESCRRGTGFVEELTDAFDGQDSSVPTAEESAYKQMSIEQLNMQLTDPRAAQDDSVLATLLILCLFHVCDSGFSKFKTQLAGVQKLMSMRDPTTQSGFTGWVEMFFTWFDVMTSAVNDREAQIQGENLDMLDFSANLGALEQFSGCDGRLFKLIARLGRLNLLSQGRPVREHPEGTSTPKPTALPLTPKRLTRSSKAKRPATKRTNRSLSAIDYEFIDGNGWGSPIITSSDDDDADGSVVEDPERPAYDERREFWAEWHDIRIRLQEWQMDTSTLPGQGVDINGQPGPDQRDLGHISESFRHSALLYITRLAHPFLPSSAPEFQGLVSQALYHITAMPVTSCVNKFLLWPLFITGTECVDAGHRNVIRQRCVEIQRESGFFNNISGLEVLERVWKDGDVGGGSDAEVRARRRDSEVVQRSGNFLAGGGPPKSAGCARQAFRWRRAMDRVDGEYIVI